MSSLSETYAELVELVELQLESRISPEQFRQLEQIIRDDSAARRVYREYMDLHGVLHWDTARVGDQPLTPPETVRPARRPVVEKLVAAVITVAAVVVVSGLAYVFNRPVDSGDHTIATDARDGDRGVDGTDAHNGVITNIGDGSRNGHPTNLRTPDKAVVDVTDPSGKDTLTSIGPVETPERSVEGPTEADGPPPGDLDSLVAYIDAELRQGWLENDVSPSELADDSEWLRRVYLDVVGHIPTARQVNRFLDDNSPDKRYRLLDELLDDEDYVRNWSTVWTNLLIGRSNPRGVNRPALQKYLREAFARNRPWNEVVGEFIAATGRPEENGAANFLLAHVNNQAVPATAITARLFLGLQIQCTQCHDHPFNDSKQDQFWAFNSFFQQVEVKNAALVDEPVYDATYYETRQGILKATFPAWETVSLGPDLEGEDVNLRSELASVLTYGEKPQIARAFVNRMWKYFTGAAFTPAVDEMGPHVAVSHPQLLDGLSRDFVHSGYDVKRLIRGICRSNVYNLTSRSSEGNRDQDDPSVGLDPLFTRAYVKPMTVEQLFDSLLIATDASDVFGSDWDAAEKRRQNWLQQFVMAFNTDENDEADLFNGTIPQALMMMNSELVQQAVTGQGGSLDTIFRGNRNSGESAQITAISLAALSRRPSRDELTAVRRLIAENVSDRPAGIDAGTARRSSMQDLFWAYLNSNEFILIH